MTRTNPLYSLAEFRYQIRRFLSFSRRAANASGLEGQQHQMLLVIASTPPGQISHIGRLAQRLFLHHNTAVELVNRLERKGLARRVTNPKDRRQVGVLITARGERLLAKLTRHHLAELRTAGPELIRALQAVIKGARKNGAHKNAARTPPRSLRHARGRNR